MSTNPIAANLRAWVYHEPHDPLQHREEPPMSITIPVDAVKARLDNGRLWLKGWGTPTDPTAGTCLHGAIRYCQPTPGDAYLIEQVGARFGFGTLANDEAADFAAVERMLVEHAEITDGMLAVTFGPQWESIVALVRRAAVITPDEAQKVGAARGAAWGAARGAAKDAAWDAAWVAAWVAVRAAARDAARAAARDDARDAAWAAVRAAAWDAAVAAAWDAAWAAVWDAAWALVTRDLIGQHGYTQSHYDLLTRPWASVIGPVHPDDKPVTA